MIGRIITALGLLPPPPPVPEAARTLSRRAAQVKAAARRQAIAAHIAKFGPHARGLDRLTQGDSNA